MFTSVQALCSTLMEFYAFNIKYAVLYFTDILFTLRYTLLIQGRGLFFQIFNRDGICFKGERIFNFILSRIFLDALKQICKDYYERSFLCESQKWDLEYEVRKRDYEVNRTKY